MSPESFINWKQTLLVNKGPLLVNDVGYIFVFAWLFCWLKICPRPESVSGIAAQLMLISLTFLLLQMVMNRFWEHVLIVETWEVGIFCSSPLRSLNFLYNSKIWFSTSCIQILPIFQSKNWKNLNYLRWSEV